MSKEFLDKHFEERGITIVYSFLGRRVILDDSVNGKDTDYYLRHYEYMAAEVDWKSEYKRSEIVGYGALHPYWEPQQRKKR